MRIEKYFFVNTEGKPILRQNAERFCICGEVYGKDGFSDGDNIVTSFIVECDEKIATTKSGAVYELGTMHPDYVEMLDASESGKVILSNWNVEQRLLMDEIPRSVEEFEEFEQSRSHQNYVLEGKDQNGHDIIGEVLRQEGNYVTIKYISLDLYTVSTKELTIFVNWPSINQFARMTIQISRSLADIKYDDFETCFFQKCRPKFPCREEK